ncbi:MAG: aldo/keto reductase, partial [Planctomycetaceae bacterium]
DTAPAYGVAEERIGRALGDRLCECVVSTKAGEVFTGGRSLYDFSRPAVLRSIEESSRRLRREPLDLVFMHGHADDLDILNDTPIVETMLDLKAQGRIRAIGFSGKTVAAARQALSWADALMVEYHLHDRSHEAVISEAALRGVGIVVKKGLASGQLPAAESIRFVLGNPHVTSLVIGGLDLAHLQANLAEARQIRAA